MNPFLTHMVALSTSRVPTAGYPWYDTALNVKD